MESASLSNPGGLTVEKPELKQNAITFLSNIVIGVASTAPAYSLAATLGFIAAVTGLGYHSPAVMIVAFVPMICIAAAYNHLNRADPDCGTTFAWVTKSMGPWMGWQGGWAIVVADVLVMPSLAQVAGQYTFALFGDGSPSNLSVTIVGIVWIILMTAICYIGIELNARTQQVLLGLELFILALFCVVALIKVYSGHPPNSVHLGFSWFNPFSIHSLSTFNDGILLAIFVYWGWDSGVSVNEETENTSSAPGHAAIVSTIVLVLVYVFATAATQAFGGLQELINHPDDVFAPISRSVLGSPLDKLLILAVLSSASASTQTTILPTARTTLSMGRAGAIPKKFASIHPRFRSPGFSTIWMGAVSALVYILLSATSNNLIGDAFTSLALTIAFYYGITGYASVVYYRRHLFESLRNFFMLGVVPLFGGVFLTAVLAYAVVEYSKPHSGYAKPFLGIGSPIAIALLTIVLGLVGMLIQRLWMPGFFRHEPGVVDPAILAGTKIGTASFAGDDV